MTEPRSQGAALREIAARLTDSYTNERRAVAALRELASGLATAAAVLDTDPIAARAGLARAATAALTLATGLEDEIARGEQTARAMTTETESLDDPYDVDPEG